MYIVNCPFDITWKDVFCFAFYFKWTHFGVIEISYQKPFFFCVFWSQIFTVKLNLRPKIGPTCAISIVKWLFWCFLKGIFFFFFFFLGFVFLCWFLILGISQKHYENSNKWKLLNLPTIHLPHWVLHYFYYDKNENIWGVFLFFFFFVFFFCLFFFLKPENRIKMFVCIGNYDTNGFASNPNKKLQNIFFVKCQAKYDFPKDVERRQVYMSYITKTHLYNFDPLKPQFYIVKLEFTGVYIIFLIFAQKFWLWLLVRTASPGRF